MVAEYDQPTLLDVKEIRTSRNGSFVIEDTLMKMLIYQAKVTVSQHGYLPQTQTVTLYDTFNYSFAHPIVIKPHYFAVVFNILVLCHNQPVNQA